MGRINSNISSLTAQQNLARSNNELGTRLQRLATGLRINRGADDPAGLIVSERLRSELSGIDQGVRNSERASNVIATTTEQERLTPREYRATASVSLGDQRSRGKLDAARNCASMARRSLLDFCRDERATACSSCATSRSGAMPSPS